MWVLTSTDVCGCVGVWFWINQIQQCNKSSLIDTQKMCQNKSLAVFQLGRKMFLCRLLIELGMSLISAFPVDTITFMFFMDINPDALLCLLVLVKKIIERQDCHIIITGSIRLFVITVLALYVLEKLKPSQNSDQNPNQNWVIWLKCSCRLWKDIKSAADVLADRHTVKRWLVQLCDTTKQGCQIWRGKKDGCVFI